MNETLTTPGQQPEQTGRAYRFDADKHVHLLNETPLIGTSTAVQVLAKPLTWWAAGMALTPLGWINKRKSKAADRLNAASVALEWIKNLTPNGWAGKLEECYRAHHDRKESAAVDGTAMHKCLQDYVEMCIYDFAGEPQEAQDSAEVLTFCAWALENVSEFLWAEAHCYSERMWVGGICDCGAILKTGGLAIIDFKSSKEAYYSQFVQAGGYAAQIKENGLWRADGTPVSTAMRHVDAAALVIFPFGGTGEPAIKRNVEGYAKAFEAAVCLHKLQGLFDSGADFAPVKTLSGGVATVENQRVPVLAASNVACTEAVKSTQTAVAGSPAQNLSEPIGITATLAFLGSGVHAQQTPTDKRR